MTRYLTPYGARPRPGSGVRSRCSSSRRRTARRARRWGSHIWARVWGKTRGIMAKQGDPKEIATLQELAVSNAYELAALVAVLERKGLLTQQEILEEIQRHRRKNAQ